MNNALVVEFIVYCILTILIYQGFARIQQWSKLIWLNPMLLTMLVIIPLLLTFGIGFDQYYQHTQIFSYLLEPAIVALGYPLYQQIQVIKSQIKQVMLVLCSSIMLMLVANFVLAMWLFNQSDIAVSLSLKSVTTPIGLALTEQLNGVAAITAVGIIVAGLVGGVFGPKLLTLCGITCKKSQGLAVGCASHALGTASISHLSFQHGAFSSLALILSALITAVFSPLIIPVILNTVFAIGG
ncbi:LrgB family protein [Thalassotalea sp. M1531]|uniref:LrgB family protein n=1 Tax=Thalassotalea algicola TaxID=2716224 RepID=A0A7Y0LDY1_9GAMM|nr:LrgB family protein [Thalassotalea algicola]NMP32512.1 LrgB family protein [Thalassotalea algicola]